MGKKSKNVELLESPSPEKRKRKLNGKTEEAAIEHLKNDDEPVKVKKVKKAAKDESAATVPADGQTKSPKKKKKKEKKGASTTEGLDEVEESTEIEANSKRKKKKKDKTGEKIEADSPEAPLSEDETSEVPKKKSKKEKQKRDKSLDAFNSLKDDAVDGDEAVDNGVEATKNSKKRDKKLKKADHFHETKGHGKALRYLDAWNELQNGKAGWKFEKCRQIWLLAHAYDKDKVPDSKFDVLLKYMASIQGKMRASALGNFCAL